MPKTFDGIQALQFLKRGYAVRCCLWEPYAHIRWDKKSNKILNARGDAWRHGAEELLTEVLWEFYCNPASNDVAPCEAKPELPTHGTWEWAKVAMEQGKKVRKCVWQPTSYLEMRGDDLWGSVGKSCANFEEYREGGPYGWEEYIEPQAPKKGMTWEEANEQLNIGKRVKRIGWRHGTWLMRSPYGADSVCDETGNICSVCDTDKNASDWEAIK